MSKLYLIPTPIGNLEDITLRALRILKEEIDLVLAEDTRTTGNLLRHYGISKKIQAHHLHNEHQTAVNYADMIAGGLSVAYLSDAGSPGISDPGFLLVRACIEKGVVVESLPGPTAFVPALVNSGLPCDRFLFEGFLPHKKGRQTRLAELSNYPFTIVFYESPHRIGKSLTQMAEFFGADRRACVSRELTKLFEENRRGSLAELAKYYSCNSTKGEIVVIVEGVSKRKPVDDLDRDEDE